MITACCPLCRANQLRSYLICKPRQSKERAVEYLSCFQCDLIFTPEKFHLNDLEEKKRYDSHQNNPKDQQYRAFLSQVFNPVIDYIKIDDKGLDFGCGPGPTLSVMFKEQGYSVDLFDKFYANNPTIFNRRYDFITATEVVEHLSKPGDELNRLYAMLNRGGVLAIMTKMFNHQIDFKSWYYKDDPTHICFFSQNTMCYLAKLWGADIKFYSEDVTVFFK